MIKRLILALILSLLINSCASFSFKTDKASVEVDDKKVEVEGVEVNTEK